jgi:hypothetical protein
MLNDKQTPPPLKATAALPKTLPTLLLPTNALTITKLPLLHLLLLTLQTYTYLLCTVYCKANIEKYAIS